MSSPDPSAPDRRTGDVPPGEILAPSPVLTLIAFLTGVGIDWAFPVALLTWPWNLPLGAGLLVVGSLVFGGAIRTMRAHEKHPSHSDEPPELIRDGVYRYSRNPIYVGHSIAHVGGSVLVNSVWPLVTLVPVVLYLRRVIQQEEARLEALFGPEYDRYREDVRRWL